jgi:hypothetical protein
MNPARGPKPSRENNSARIVSCADLTAITGPNQASVQNYKGQSDLGSKTVRLDEIDVLAGEQMCITATDEHG